MDCSTWVYDNTLDQFPHQLWRKPVHTKVFPQGTCILDYCYYIYKINHRFLCVDTKHFRYRHYTYHLKYLHNNNLGANDPIPTEAQFVVAC